ncbi:MAG: hypothetical protein HC912_07060 [Saprospiraceae bacterium]|nr:hypothetical protein [Saprospiraceae bacterium]
MENLGLENPLLHYHTSITSQSASIEGEIIYHTQNDNLVNLLNLTTNQINNIRGKEISMIFQEPMTALNPVIKCGHQITEIIKQHERLSEKRLLI